MARAAAGSVARSAVRAPRLLALATLVLGVLAMHTFGHPGDHGTPAADAAVVHSGHQHHAEVAEPAAPHGGVDAPDPGKRLLGSVPVVPRSGDGLGVVPAVPGSGDGLAPVVLCLAVLTGVALAVALLPRAGLPGVAARPASFGALRVATSTRPPPRTPSLSMLSIQRI